MTDAPVLITGELGTGKELMAQTIHAWSPRHAHPFVKLSCAASSSEPLEVRLFGSHDHPGRWTIARGGTLLLDDIGTLSKDAQARLLQILQTDREDQENAGDVRIIVTSQIDLETEARAGRFLEELYYRLNVFPLSIPPLRERPEDIDRIAEQFLSERHRDTGRGPWTLSPDARQRLRTYAWPGNIRELLNQLEHAILLTPKGAIHLMEPPPQGKVEKRTGPLPPLADIERAYYLNVLEQTQGKIYGPNGAAEVTGLKPSTLQSRLGKLGIKRS